MSLDRWQALVLEHQDELRSRLEGRPELAQAAEQAVRERILREHSQPKDRPPSWIMQQLQAGRLHARPGMRIKATKRQVKSFGVEVLLGSSDSCLAYTHWFEPREVKRLVGDEVVADLAVAQT